MYLSHAEDSGTVWLNRTVDQNELDQIEEDISACIANCKVGIELMNIESVFINFSVMDSQILYVVFV